MSILPINVARRISLLALTSLRRVPASTVTGPTPVIAFPDHQGRFYSSKKSKGGKKRAVESVDDILDELSDDEDVAEAKVEARGEIPDTPAAKFIEDWEKTGGLDKGKKKDKSSGSSKRSLNLDYHDVRELINIDLYWGELGELLDEQRKFFVHHLNVRSTNSLDNLEVELEGDKYPLKELASISKRDPKRLTIDTSTFPQATSNIMDILRASDLNVNPQQDGTRIYVSLPKVTKEHREKLCKSARSRFQTTKDQMRILQNKKIKALDSSSTHAHKDNFTATKAIVMAIEHHFVKLAEADLVKKQKDLMGDK